tara:strand:- start:1016 stop:1546 length:531 start_codon:yes stop_codon:yes gene_type:complete
MEGWSSRRCVLTWKLLGTPFNRSYFRLAASAHPTDGTECGLLLTPTSTQICEDPEKTQARTKDKGYNKGSKYNSLVSQVVYGLLPTPVASDHVPKSKMRPSREATNRKTGYLSEMTGMLPTPTTGADHKTQYAQGGKSLRCALGQSSQLSPLFVEEMMGFPKNWTALPFQSGDEKA